MALYRYLGEEDVVFSDIRVAPDGHTLVAVPNQTYDLLKPPPESVADRFEVATKADSPVIPPFVPAEAPAVDRSDKEQLP